MKKMFFITLLFSFILVGCANDSTTTSYKSSSNQEKCIEPENPYNDGGGHDAGFKWAEEKGGSCDGNSSSFNEGCEEYQIQLQRYNNCRN